jgi:CRISPR/Cas system-associated endonuclease/helicase Cas3
MKQILNNYCNKENGLLLFDPPTGSGKTYNVLSWIYHNYKDFCKENRKIFFVTNLKKNLPDQKLKIDFFIPNKELKDFENYVTF